MQTFFAGDIANVLGAGENSPGFTRLRQYNEQLEVGYSSLCQILSAQKQRQELVDAGYGDLLDHVRFTHEIRLLSLEWETKVDLLKQVAGEGWTVRQLGEAIAAHRNETGTRRQLPRRPSGWMPGSGGWTRPWRWSTSS